VTKLKIIKYPDPFLKQKCLPVTSFDKELKILTDNMLKTMYESEGIGLSAIQIGVLKRIIVIDITEELKKPLILINPVITPSNSKFLEFKEGCLSFPGIYESVKRNEEIAVDYNSIEGKKLSMKATGLLSICIQHEVDHLEGVVFLDRLSGLKRNRAEKKFLKMLNR
jgi:peptide deformylase